MKLVIDLQNEPSKDSVIIYDGNAWKCINKVEFLSTTNKEISNLKNDIANMKSALNKEFENIHNILKLLGKKGGN